MRLLLFVGGIPLPLASELSDAEKTPPPVVCDVGMVSLKEVFCTLVWHPNTEMSLVNTFQVSTKEASLPATFKGGPWWKPEPHFPYLHQHRIYI